MYLQNGVWENILIDIICDIGTKGMVHNTKKYIGKFS